MISHIVRPYSIAVAHSLLVLCCKYTHGQSAENDVFFMEISYGWVNDTN